MGWSIFTQGGDASAVAFGESLLRQIGAPVTSNNVQFVYDWMRSEGGGFVNNPLNVNNADYPDLSSALSASAAALQLPYYASVVASLKADAPPQQTAAALWASPWASGHYGYGAAWFSGGAPGVAPATLAASSSSSSGAQTGGSLGAAAATGLLGLGGDVVKWGDARLIPLLVLAVALYMLFASDFGRARAQP